jgi:hypothetical protein
MKKTHFSNKRQQNQSHPRHSQRDNGSKQQAEPPWDLKRLKAELELSRQRKAERVLQDLEFKREKDEFDLYMKMPAWALDADFVFEQPDHYQDVEELDDDQDDAFWDEEVDEHSPIRR